jgi:hypothetical protein
MQILLRIRRLEFPFPYPLAYIGCNPYNKSTGGQMLSTDLFKVEKTVAVLLIHADVALTSAALEKMLELVAMPLTHPEVHLYTSVQSPRSVLLLGPPSYGIV